MRIAGTSALVAGGASGLGEATARALIEAGAAVTIADLNAEKGEALAAELGPSATFIQADVTDEKAVSAAVERAASH
ncbi:MAG TPA: SDR family NAD(P)-dependent oxidoreductase, partial [Solirubrobacterales bacterium]